MARNLVWQTWQCDEDVLARVLSEMQTGGWSQHSLHVTRLGVGLLSCRLLLVASRFEEMPEHDNVWIPVDETVFAAYQQLPPAEQQAMQVVLGGMVTRYLQQHGGEYCE